MTGSSACCGVISSGLRSSVTVIYLVEVSGIQLDPWCSLCRDAYPLPFPKGYLTLFQPCHNAPGLWFPAAIRTYCNERIYSSGHDHFCLDKSRAPAYVL